MQPVIINARWSCDGIRVQNADYFSVQAFICLIIWNVMHAPIRGRIRNSFKHRADFVKKTFNYKFPPTEIQRVDYEHTDEELSAYQFLLKPERHAIQS